MVQDGTASLDGETHELRRRRILACALAMAAVHGVLGVFFYAMMHPGKLEADDQALSLRVCSMALRCALAASVAGLLLRDAAPSRKQLRAIEHLLFLGLTASMVASQSVVGPMLIRQGPDSSPALLAYFKDIVIQTLILMMVYGTLIPNRPAVTARTLMVMLAGPFVALLLIRLQPGTAEALRRLASIKEAGSNIPYLAIGVVLACYGSYLLNGLRSELHDARKFGQYRLLEKIGQGGMGEVYLAEHQLLKRPCALKLIRPEAGTSPLALARFGREVRSVSRLSHPNTIAIYDYGHAHDGTFYYVMEYLPGMSLHDLVKKAGPLPPARVIHLLRQVCGSLAEAHDVGLVHRDLKPANIFISHRGGESDVAKVLDFGLVKLTGDPQAPRLTAEMAISGTPSFMAPEQAGREKDIDGRADLYAMGAVAYYALTGRPPFAGQNPFAVMMAHIRDRAIPPSVVRPGIPEDLEAVVLKALEKQPDDRHPDARALGSALAACEDSSAWDARVADRWWREHRGANPSPTAGDGRA